MKTATKAWINGIVLLVVLAINYISTTGIINGTNQKEMSDKYMTPITPAPFTFSIWGIIYTLLFVSIILMILNRNNHGYKRTIDRLSPLFWLSSAFNIGWIITFLYDQILISSIFIAAFTVTLIQMNRILLEVNDDRKNTLALSFGLYNGWLLIATIINIAAYLVKIDWNRFGLSEEVWGIILLAIASVLAILLMVYLKNAAFTIPAAWGSFGIYKSLVSPDGFNNMYSMLVVVAIACLIVLAISFVVQFKNNHWRIIPAPKYKF
ncbi:MAG: tryptophan-rich sensory protein [Pisciglobus halotolerans]|nr:tryptophan-rich sensory protein [Pisciglobus halotolerans]